MVDESGSAPFLDLVIDRGALITSKSSMLSEREEVKSLNIAQNFQRLLGENTAKRILVQSKSSFCTPPLNMHL